jgi:hypothetical protein
MTKKFLAVTERWLAMKIGVEIRCCLPFFLMLFFYCVYRLLGGNRQAEILHIAEMIGAAYLFGWVQALLHADFDEMERLGLRQWAVILAGSAVYTLTAWLGGWFCGNAAALLLFFLYMIACCLCTLLIYGIKRAIDARLLNEDLRSFQQRSGE